jgi:hypothetical protein
MSMCSNPTLNGKWNPRSVWAVTQHGSDGGYLSSSKYSQEDTENEIEKAS